MKTLVSALFALTISVAATLPASAATTPPVYPGAVATTRPAGVGLKAPQAS